MKVSSITPHFVFEKPAGEDTVEQKRTAEKLHDKINRAESAHDSTAKEDLDQETREGLKRFLKLVKKSKEKAAEPEANASGAAPQLAKGVSAYRSVQRYDEGFKNKGSLVNKKC